MKKNEAEGVSFLMKSKSTIKGEKRSLTVQKVQELFFSFKLQAWCITKKKKRNMRRLFDKKGNEFNARETQGKHTCVANKNMERGDQLTKILLHNKYDGMRILGHIQSDPPKTDFPYSLAHPNDRRQRNKGGN